MAPTDTFSRESFGQCLHFCMSHAPAQSHLLISYYNALLIGDKVSKLNESQGSLISKIFKRPFQVFFLFSFIDLFFALDSSQCPEMILNKFEKTFNKTYTGLKSVFQRFQICFSHNPCCKGMESTSQAAMPYWPTSGRIGCTAQLVDSMPLQLGF